MKRVLVIVAGSLLILIGVVGLFLPIVPQVPFLLGGLSLLATQVKAAKVLKDKLEARLSKAAQRFSRKPGSKPATTEATADTSKTTP